MGNVCSQQDNSSQTYKKIIVVRTSKNTPKDQSLKENSTFQTTSPRSSQGSSQPSPNSSLIAPPNLIHHFDLDVELQRLEDELFASMESDDDPGTIDLCKMQKSNSFLFEDNTIRQK